MVLAGDFDKAMKLTDNSSFISCRCPIFSARRSGQGHADPLALIARSPLLSSSKITAGFDLSSLLRNALTLFALDILTNQSLAKIPLDSFLLHSWEMSLR